MKTTEIIKLRVEQSNVEVDCHTLRLREKSKFWTPKMWESYLQTLEVPLLEAQIPIEKYAALSETVDLKVFDFGEANSRPAALDGLPRAIHGLTDRQREVIELIYFRSMTSRQAAQELGIAQTTIVKLKKKALRNLFSRLSGGVFILPLVEGQENQKEDLND